jgi:hypothetical protein
MTGDRNVYFLPAYDDKYFYYYPAAHVTFLMPDVLRKQIMLGIFPRLLRSGVIYAKCSPYRRAL